MGDHVTNLESKLNRLEKRKFLGKGADENRHAVDINIRFTALHGDNSIC